MKRLATFALLLATLMILASCTNATTPEASPSPTVSAAPMATPTVEASPLVSMMPAEEVRPVADDARIQIDGKDIVGVPYYNENQDLVFPIKSVAEALGWGVEEASSGAQETMTLTKEGQEDVTVQFTKPGLGKNLATGVSAKKGTAALDLDGTQVYAENMLYAPESFFDDALGDIQVNFDGAKLVTITPGT